MEKEAQERSELEQFVDAYMAMRKSQKGYFKTKSLGNLKKAKELEYRLDRKADELAKRFGLLVDPLSRQGSIF